VKNKRTIKESDNDGIVIVHSVDDLQYIPS